MPQGSSEPFLVFADDDLTWWGEEPAPRSPPGPPGPVRRRRRRPPPRTFAGDLARLRTALARQAAGSPAALGLSAGVLVLAVAAGVLLTGGGGEPAQPAPAPAEQAASSSPAPAGPRSPAPDAAPEAAALRSGDRGAAVRDLQVALALLGVSDQPADGAFGPATAAAVASFQGAGGLLADGIAGPATADALRAAVLERAGLAVEQVEQGLADAVAAARLDAAAADRHQATLAGAVEALAGLPPGRSATVGAVLGTVASHADVYDAPRSLALFGMLAANAAHLAANPLPPDRVDIADDEGVAYRYFPAHGFQFHPLANFSRLNRLAGREESEAARRLADALLARAVPSGRTLAWEYYFPFGGPSRWTSGFAQAVAAQALARGGALLGQPRLLRRAAAAFRLLPVALSQPIEGGTWLREYGYSDMAVLNAQLQSLVSLGEYVEISGDEQARVFLAEMTSAARTLIDRFDTGCWSRYSLDGAPATPSYHAYHVNLLAQLARRTDDPLWRETGARWRGYERSGGC